MGDMSWQTGFVWRVDDMALLWSRRLLMTNEQENTTIWMGYSWLLGYPRSYLCISVSDSWKFTHYPVAWDSNVKSSIPPPLGIMDTIGIAGLGTSPIHAQSKLSDIDTRWGSQIKKLERSFERVLADTIQGVIYERLKNTSKEERYRLNIVIQGPAFPKLLGRLSYRHLRASHSNMSVYFMTFRRRFLTPGPLLLKEGAREIEKGLIRGPYPNDHEESVVRRYYILPRTTVPATKANEFPFASDIVYNTPEPAVSFCPLMLEFFCQNQDDERENEMKALATFLADLKIYHADENGFCTDGNEWSVYPSPAALQRVIVPSQLLEANRQSRKKLQELLGEKKEGISIGDKARRFFEYYKRCFPDSPLAKEAARGEDPGNRNYRNEELNRIQEALENLDREK
jgi:hypothetical protein